jgi:hypothetical protein
MSISHDDISGRLSDYIDDELDERERTEVERHLDECGECRTSLEDLRAIVAVATRLPQQLPDRELWGGIAGRLGAGPRRGIIRFEIHGRRRFSFTLPQMAAAALALVLLSGGMVYLTLADRRQATAVSAAPGPGEPGDVLPIALTDPHYDSAVADLERILQAGRGRLDPMTVRVLEENLASIDNAIEQSRRALEADPANSFLTSHLVSARQRKLALLRRATALTTGS